MKQPKFKLKPTLMEMAQVPFKVTRELSTLRKVRYIAMEEDDLDGIEGYLVDIEEDQNHRKWFIIPQSDDITHVDLMYCPRQDTSWFTHDSRHKFLAKDVSDLEYEFIEKFSENYGLKLLP